MERRAYAVIREESAYCRDSVYPTQISTVQYVYNDLYAANNFVMRLAQDEWDWQYSDEEYDCIFTEWKYCIEDRDCGHIILIRCNKNNGKVLYKVSFYVQPTYYLE